MKYPQLYQYLHINTNIQILLLKKEPLVSTLNTRGLSLFIICLAIYTCNAYFALIAACVAKSAKYVL